MTLKPLTREEVELVVRLLSSTGVRVEAVDVPGRRVTVVVPEPKELR